MQAVGNPTRSGESKLPPFFVQESACKKGIKRLEIFAMERRRRGAGAAFGRRRALVDADALAARLADCRSRARGHPPAAVESSDRTRRRRSSTAPESRRGDVAGAAQRGFFLAVRSGRRLPRWYAGHQLGGRGASRGGGIRDSKGSAGDARQRGPFLVGRMAGSATA